MKARFLLFVLVSVSLLSGGCKSKPTLAGEWTGSVAVQNVNVETNMKFGGDGTFELTQSAMGAGSTQKGKYKEEEKSFSITATSIETSSIPKETLDKLNANLAKNPKPVTFTLEWKDPDTIAVTQQGVGEPAVPTITLKRKK